MAFQTSAAGICTSLHLKINTPSGLRTRIHSLKPSRNIFGQFSFNDPYFLTSQEVSPALFKCGGSNTTSENVLSSNGRFVKSQITSGSTMHFLSLSPHTPVYSSFLLSQYTAAGWFLSNHIVFEPHVASNIFLSILFSSLHHKSGPRGGIFISPLLSDFQKLRKRRRSALL